MFTYVVRRIVATIPVMAVVALFVFSLLFIAPGDPAAVIAGDQATPADVVDRLNKEIDSGLADPAMKARFAELGGTVILGSPADFAGMISRDTEKWAKVIKDAGIEPQ